MTSDTSQHTLELNVQDDSRIISVTVYPDCAKITRAFPLKLRSGSTSITISGGLLYKKDAPEILKLEKRGDIILRDVNITAGDPPDSTETKDLKEVSLKALLKEKDLLKMSLARHQLAPVILTTFVESMDLTKMTVVSLDEALETFNDRTTKWEHKIQELEGKIAEIEGRIQSEMNPASVETKPSQEDPQLSNHIIQFVTDAIGAVRAEVWLIYTASGASWTADYDIAFSDVHSLDVEAKAIISYRGLVANNTAGSWEDVGITFETMARSKQDGELAIRHFQYTEDASKIAIPNAIHSVVGNITIPKGKSLKVLITRFEPALALERFCIPKMTTQGKVTNTLEYALPPGRANVFSDGDFLQSVDFNPIVVGGSFEVPLGFDTTIKVDYLPLTKTTTSEHPEVSYAHSRSYMIHHCHRQIAIINSRKTVIPNMVVVDGYPLGQPDVYTYLIFPALQVGTGKPIVTTDSPNGSNVIVSWDRVIAPVESSNQLGTKGLISWECTIGAESEIQLELRWQARVDVTKQVRGFD
ncbi:hypothetical protein P691DRAFT_780803 [Macrolepiota fuliginosa MF-IS2]|uniref:Mucoidy inhibitor A n=1 Tax=Macrolepiota fuliginosa MF-IS2 TaxID=1400762 RepID=A0A9P6C276_9AGAR|nr:hypothetical protein P691DRAFT_780803 [Macrolepiota fuliginosa MF-IS2]